MIAGLIVLAVVGSMIGTAIGGGGSTPKATMDVSTSADMTQNGCHDQVAAKIGTGLTYSAEKVVADHNGKGPAIMASGTVAQNGTQYFFQCSATAVPGGDVKSLKLITFITQ